MLTQVAHRVCGTSRGMPLGPAQRPCCSAVRFVEGPINAPILVLARTPVRPVELRRHGPFACASLLIFSLSGRRGRVLEADVV